MVRLTNRDIANGLRQYICPAGQPHTGDDPLKDHGHTQCFWISEAIKRLLDDEAE